MNTQSYNQTYDSKYYTSDGRMLGWLVAVIVVVVVIVVFIILFFPIYYTIGAGGNTTNESPSSPNNLQVTQSDLKQWIIEWDAPTNPGTGTNLVYNLYISGDLNDPNTKSYQQQILNYSPSTNPPSYPFPTDAPYGKYNLSLNAQTTVGSSPYIYTIANIGSIGTFDFIPPITSTDLSQNLVFGGQYLNNSGNNAKNVSSFIVAHESSTNLPVFAVPTNNINITANEIQSTLSVFPQSNELISYIQPTYTYNGSSYYFVYNASLNRFILQATNSVANWWLYNNTNFNITNPFFTDPNAIPVSGFTVTNNINGAFYLTISKDTTSLIPMEFDPYQRTMYIPALGTNYYLGYNSSNNQLCFGINSTSNFIQLIVDQNLIGLSQAANNGLTMYIQGLTNYTLDGTSFIATTETKPNLKDLAKAPNPPSNLKVQLQ